MNPLNHVAIIMDGNGRWGIKYKNSRNSGLILKSAIFSWSKRFPSSFALCIQTSWKSFVQPASKSKCCPTASSSVHINLFLKSYTVKINYYAWLALLCVSIRKLLTSPPILASSNFRYTLKKRLGFTKFCRGKAYKTTMKTAKS